MGGLKGGKQGPVLTICVSSREMLRPNKRESPRLRSPVLTLLRPLPSSLVLLLALVAPFGQPGIPGASLFSREGQQWLD